MTEPYNDLLPDTAQVGWASEPHPLLAEVICLPCWQQLPEWREVYPCRAPAAMAHQTVCSHCGEEPGTPEAGQTGGALS